MHNMIDRANTFGILQKIPLARVNEEPVSYEHLSVERNSNVDKCLTPYSAVLKHPGEEALSKIKCRRIINVLTVF